MYQINFQIVQSLLGKSETASGVATGRGGQARLKLQVSLGRVILRIQDDASMNHRS